MSEVYKRFMAGLERGMSTEAATVYANSYGERGQSVPAPPKGLQDKIAGHPLDHDGDGRPGGSTAPEQTEDLPALRAEYQRVIGKRPFAGWSADVLKEKIANHEG